VPSDFYARNFFNYPGFQTCETDEVGLLAQVGTEKILFIPLRGEGYTLGHSSTCFNYFYHWSVIGAELLVNGVVIGGNRDDVVTVAGPHKV
jgi:hypothetical protein